MVVPASPPLLQACNVSFSYGPLKVLEEVELELTPGEITGIIGPNGSGKSTLMGIMSGLLPPSSGQVLLEGEPLLERSRKSLARVMGLVPQAPQLAHGFSVLDTVLAGRYALMGGRLFESSADRQAAQYALDQTDLSHLASRAAGELSGGERQRLALARALACSPRVLLLDEPTSALDLKHQLNLMALLEKYGAGEDRSVCLVSHDLNLAALFCAKLLLLARGRVIVQGTPQEVLTPHVLQKAYGVQTLVDADPTRNRPRVTLVPQ